MRKFLYDLTVAIVSRFISGLMLSVLLSLAVAAQQPTLLIFVGQYEKHLGDEVCSLHGGDHNQMLSSHFLR